MKQIVGIHPLAEFWPIYDDVLTEVTESIEANGLRHPLVVDGNGMLIDGRTRYRALQKLGVTEFEVEVYDGDDILEYIDDANAGRRHMSAGARAMARALMLVSAGRREGGRWVGWSRTSQDSGKSSGEREALRCAGVVLDFKPDLADAVIAGGLALDAAYQQAKAIRTSAERDKIMAREKAKREKQEAEAEAERNAQIVADLTQAGAKYVALIEDGTLTPKAAWSAYREDTRNEREAAEQARQVLKDRFVGIGKAIGTIRAWDGHDISRVMEGFAADVAPGVHGNFTTESLLAAQGFITELVEWSRGQ